MHLTQSPSVMLYSRPRQPSLNGQSEASSETFSEDVWGDKAALGTEPVPCKFTQLILES